MNHSDPNQDDRDLPDRELRDRELYEHLLLDKELEEELGVIPDNDDGENVLLNSNCLPPSRLVEITTGIRPITNAEQAHIDGCDQCRTGMSLWNDSFPEHNAKQGKSVEEVVSSVPVERSTKASHLETGRPRLGLTQVIAASIVSALLGGALVYFLADGTDSEKIAQVVTENEDLKKTVSRFESLRSSLATASAKTNSELTEILIDDPRFLAGDLSVELVRQTLNNQGQQRSPIECNPQKLELLKQKLKTYGELTELLESSGSVESNLRAKALNLTGVAEATMIATAEGEAADRHYQLAESSFRKAGELGLSKAWLNLYLLSIRWQKGDVTSRQQLLDRYLESETDESIRTFVREALE